jgi:hypothetical protein
VFAVFPSIFWFSAPSTADVPSAWKPDRAVEKYQELLDDTTDGPLSV